MPEQVKSVTKRARVQEMLALSEELRTRFLKRFENTATNVLFEQRTRGNEWEGLTGNYIRVIASSEDPLENRMANVRLESRAGNGVHGTLLTEMS